MSTPKPRKVALPQEASVVNRGAPLPAGAARGHAPHSSAGR